MVWQNWLLIFPMTILQKKKRFIVAAKLIRIPKDSTEQKLTISEVFTRLGTTVAFYKYGSTILEKKNSAKGVFNTIYIHTAVRE